MQKFSSLIVFGCIFFLAGCIRQPSALQQLPDHSFTTLKLGSRQLKVEVVNTAASTEQGLSDRDQIGSDGMLFVFPQKSLQRFWMSKMKFDLDFIWLDDLKVVDLTKNVPHPQQSGDNNLPIYAPKAPVNQVLEVPAGSIDNWQLKIGDTFVQAK